MTKKHLLNIINILNFISSQYKIKKFLSASILTLSISFFSFTFAEINSGNVTTFCSTGATVCNLNYKHIDGIASGTFINHTNLKTLNLYGNDITSIEEGDFYGLENLTGLLLNDNDITSIDFGDFVGLSNLEVLELGYNQINTIDSGVLDVFTNLTKLRLDQNQLSSIDNINFNLLTNLTDLDLSYNQLNTINSGAINGLSNLTKLNLSSNQLSSIDTINFNLYPNLTSLSLSNNPITFINPNTFNGLSNLTHLYLNGMQITSIEENTFSGLSLLSYLTLIDNQIASVEKGDFYGLENLISLYLYNNQISSIGDYAFAGLSNLDELYLYNNQISSIGKYSFAGLSNLTDLRMYNNIIKTIDVGAFSGVSSLTYLTLGGFGIEEIGYDAFYGMTSLNSLYLYRNQLSSINEGIFNGLDNLTELDLSSNQITTINSGALNGLSNLTYFYLNNNQFSSIEDINFDGLNNLSELDLSYNQITTINSGALNGLSNLTYFYLNNNPISSIDSDSFNNLSLLDYLDLSTTCTASPLNIVYVGGSSNTDNLYCGITNTTNQADFITELTNKSYTLNNDMYIGTYAISFVPEISNEILANIIMKSENTNSYTQEYYQNNVEVQYDSGTLITTNGQSYTGVLQPPVLLNTGSTKTLKNIVSITKFGDSSKNINFSKSVTVRIPVLGKNFGDSIKIYYTQDLNGLWTYHTTTTVIDVSGVPYVEFTTDHATYFAIGEEFGSFVINNDDLSTTTQEVTLIIDASGAINMRFSNDGSGWSTWETYATSKTRTLDSGVGTKIVYAEFDIDNNTGTVEASTSDTIEYIIPADPGTTGQLTLEILTGESECVYSTSLNLGDQDVKLDQGYTFTGAFSGQRYCTDYIGKSDGWVLDISVSDLTNGLGNIISGTGITISHDGAVTEGDSTCTGYDGAADTFNIDPYELIEKPSGSDKICKVTLSNVNIEVAVPAFQAPGSYNGTLTLTVPNF